MNPYQNHTDNELVALFTSGNKMAFETIYRRYASALYGYARKNISNHDDCEEIIQDIFVSLWERHGHLGHVTSLNAYLYRMVKYKIIRYFQHERVRQRYAEHFRLFEALYESGLKEGQDVQAAIDQGLAALPERCRMAVRFRLRENLSNDEIATRMSIKKTTVENYMVAAVRHLRASLPGLLDMG